MKTKGNMKIEGKLTPRFIQNALGPYLDALANLQHTIDAIKKNKSPSPITIKEIAADDTETQGYNLSNLKEKLAQSSEELRELQTFFRRHGETLRELEEAFSRKEEFVKSVFEEIRPNVLWSFPYQYFLRQEAIRAQLSESPLRRADFLRHLLLVNQLAGSLDLDDEEIERILQWVDKP